jgi:hypothetical protein
VRTLGFLGAAYPPGEGAFGNRGQRPTRSVCRGIERLWSEARRQFRRGHPARRPPSRSGPTFGSAWSRELRRRGGTRIRRRTEGSRHPAVRRIAPRPLRRIQRGTIPPKREPRHPRGTTWFQRRRSGPPGYLTRPPVRGGFPEVLAARRPPPCPTRKDGSSPAAEAVPIARTGFALFSGGVSWIGSWEELQAQPSAYSPIRRWIGRWLQYLL